MKPVPVTFIEFFGDKDFSLPIWEITILIILVSACLILGKHKVGLILAYIGLFYWGFIFNRAYIVDLLGGATWAVYVYSAAGVVMAIMAILALFIKGDE
jgi:hypothetical protein